MSLFKRNKTWWTDFSVNGVRYRLTLDTTDWREAQRLEKSKISDATTGKLAPASQQFARLAFSQAADRYLENRRLELSERSSEKEEYLLVAPRKFFGVTSLARIGAEDLIRYREERAKQAVSPTYINMEMGVVRRILKRAKRWHLVADDLKPLKERHRIGRVLTPQQKARLLKMADSKPDWLNAKLAQILALNTTMRSCEIKGLRWSDVNLIERTLTIGRNTTKTDAGERVIPLNGNAMSAIVELYRRAQDDKATEPDHYLFPACENNKIDPTRPQKSWRTAWRRLTRAIQCPTCSLQQDPGETCRNLECKADIRNIKSPTEGLHFHDLRHHAITELAESPVSDQTVMAIAGHVSAKMLRRYSHVRMLAKRKALDALSVAPLEGDGHGTNNATNGVSVTITHPQVFENMVGPWGLEPQTSTVSR